MQEFWCQKWGWADNTWWPYNTYPTVEADTHTHTHTHILYTHTHACTHAHAHTHTDADTHTHGQTGRQTDPEGQVAEISKEASTPSGKLGVRAMVLVRRCRQRVNTIS